MIKMTNACRRSDGVTHCTAMKWKTIAWKITMRVSTRNMTQDAVYCNEMLFVIPLPGWTLNRTLT
jgi:hypothetical protein